MPEIKMTEDDIHHLLTSVGIEPDPDFKSELRTRLRQELDRRASSRRLPRNEKRRVFEKGANAVTEVSTVRSAARWGGAVRPLWLAFGSLLVVLIGLGLVFAVPSARAQVGSFLSRLFTIHIGDRGSAVISSEFTPFYPAYIPDRLNYFATLVGGEPGSMYTELRYYNQTEFIVVYEVQVTPDETLPEGEAIQIDGQPAVLVRSLSGTVQLTTGEAQTGRPESLGGGGGGGGSGPEPLSPPPVSLAYTDANQLVWLYEGLRIELLSNLPLDELMQVAGALTGAQEVPPESLPEPLPYVPVEGPVAGDAPLMFEPLLPAYLPEGFLTGETYVTTDEDGTPLVEWRNHGDEQFVILVETLVAADAALPDGETVLLNGEQPAVIERGVSGTAILAPDVLQNGRQLGTPPSAVPDEPPSSPDNIAYADGVRLTWLIEDVQIVLLSNLSEAEALRVAESIAPTGHPDAP